jgi:hypothetical protein
MREGLNERKELIFEEKMKESWDRFDEERKTMRTEIDNLHKEVKLWMDKYDEECHLHQRECEEHAKAREFFQAKEKDFSLQLKELKVLHHETKKTYTATFDALKDNDRIFRSIENVAMSSSKMTSCRKPQEEKEGLAAKKYWEGQLERARTDHLEQTRELQEEVKRLSRMYEEERSRAFQQEMQLQGCREEKQKLEQELAYSSERFADTVSEIENAKERERSLYEESIVRLLGTLDKR